MIKKKLILILVITYLSRSIKAYEYSVFNNTDVTLNVYIKVGIKEKKAKHFTVKPQNEAKVKTKSDCLLDIVVKHENYDTKSWGFSEEPNCHDKHLIVNTVKNKDGTPATINVIKMGPVIIFDKDKKFKMFEITERFPKKKKKK